MLARHDTTTKAITPASRRLARSTPYASFSLHGRHPDLRLKPEFAAPGGSILPSGARRHLRVHVSASTEPADGGRDAVVLQHVRMIRCSRHGA